MAAHSPWEARFDWILSLWHDYRLPMLVLILVVVAVAQRLSRPKNACVSIASGSKRERSVSQTKKPVPILPVVNASGEKKKPVEKAHDYGDDEGKVPRQTPRRVIGAKPLKSDRNSSAVPKSDSQSIQPLIFYTSLGGTTETAAKNVLKQLSEWLGDAIPSEKVLEPQLLDISYLEQDDYFVSTPKGDGSKKFFYLVLLPSYDIDTVIDNFIGDLRETHNDFRIDTAPLSGVLGYSVFGLGDREGWPTEEEGFCSQAKEADKWLAKLTGGRRAYPMGTGDAKVDAEARLSEWLSGVQEALQEIVAGRGLGEGVAGSGDAIESDEEEDDEAAEDDGLRAKGAKKKRKANGQGRVDDVEDLGRMVQLDQKDAGPLAIDFTTYSKTSPSAPSAPALKEMVPVSSPTYAALTKQGYTIVGSHSGVKTCRWTKSALRGRGSCYKYSFYGIESHRCMEATPSLSCSNKCVFCWRHGTNPVGTTWRWVTDPPDLILDGITAAHYRKIKALKGVPGVRASRFAEALHIRHCALSLVGEPIFYPHINALVALLHARRVSTFLVCNAQHPDQLRTLAPVTQLYVSVDAPDAESLRRIDRPLHRDFWQRFTACMDILRARRREQRTVFRLTLVKGFNASADTVAGYADLVARALPGFVEVKGVTYCGTPASQGAGLTMRNVPFYAEVAAFVLALAAELRARGLDYAPAAEHEHSCCVLLADGARFRTAAGRWATRIDYDRFFELVEGGGQFAPEDYVGEETPEWALWGNGGFDPRDTRVRTKGKNRDRKVDEVAAAAAVVEVGDGGEMVVEEG